MASNVTTIAAGQLNSLLIKSDGSLWGVGYNSHGQVGAGSISDLASFQQIVTSNITAIAIAGNAIQFAECHSLFIKSDGSLWAMGDNTYGDLGDGTFSNTNLPELILASNVTAIAAGGDHSLFVKNDGSLWAMGYNQHGELGDGTFSNTNRPKQILVNPSYNKISSQFLNGSNVSLSFFGNAGANYALERSFSLSPPNWIPQVTNPANSFGALVFTNTPVATTNNFWRIRSVP